MKRSTFASLAAVLCAADVALVACTAPTAPTVINNTNTNTNTNNQIISGNVPGSGTGQGASASCAPIAEIGGKLYGSLDTRTIALSVNQTASADFTPKDAQGKTRGGTCDIDTPVEFIVSDASVCQVIPNGPSPYVPSVKGLKAGTCTVKARAGGVTTADDKDVEVRVS